MEKKLLLIINPNAGKGKIKKRIPNIIANFERNGYKIKTVYTKINYKPEQILKEHGNNVDLVVCCGGDGTLNEVINAIINLNLQLNLSFIPLGTMNDFAKTINLSRKKLALSKNINKCEIIASDVGSFNEKYFNYVVAFGAFTKVSYATSQKLKKVLGKLAYIVTAAKHLNRIKAYKVKVKFNGKEVEDNFIYGAVSNSKWVGGFKWFDKNSVKLDDGKFEMILIKKPKNPIHFIKTLISLLRKKYNEPYFVYAQVGNVEFEMIDDLDWTLDRRRRRLI